MKKIIIGIILRVILYPLLAGIALSLYFFIIYVFPQRIVSSYNPGQWKMEYQDVTLLTRDGLKLAGWFIPNKNTDKAIVVCHGYPMDKGDIFGVTEFLARDFNLLYFDFRAMGASEGRISTSGWREREDFLAGVRFLREKGFRNIGAFGFSMGAAAILMADSPDVKCIVSDSSYARLRTAMEMIFKRFGLLRAPVIGLVKLWSRLFLGINIDSVAPIKFISKLNIPVLLLHCQTDALIPVSEALELHKAYPKSQLLLIGQGDHGESSLSADYERMILEFFRKNL